MAKFPDAPLVETLRSIHPAIHRVEPGTVLWRIYFLGGAFPGRWNGFRHFGPTSSRWDPHLPGADGRAAIGPRGVMYAACGPDAVPTCLSEVFQQRRIIDPVDDAPALVGFVPTRPLELIDLTGRLPTRLGASSAMHSGPRPRARRWARAFHEAWPALHGILYCSSMYGNAPAVALFERAEPALPDEPALHRSLTDPSLRTVLSLAADECGYALVPAGTTRSGLAPAFR